jgi:uncharacterized membrane protein
MQGKSVQRGRNLTWVKGFVTILLVLGIVFRFVNLDRKVYWNDEVLTSLRVFGYTKTELQSEAFRGQVVNVAELQKYQHPSPDKGWGDTLTALMGNAEHPPLYYLLARIWAIAFGSSVAAMRSLPAVISLLALPCAYWLCRELAGNALTGWVAIGLIAVSPFHVLYAQEAREYSLWAVVILLSSAALLRADRLNTRRSWGLYALTVALGLYTHILGGLVTFAHGVYLVARQPGWFRQKTLLIKPLTPYLLASMGGLLTFLPWLVVILSNLAQIRNSTEGVRDEISFVDLTERWLTNLNRIFFDVDLGSGNLILLVLVVYVLYWLYRHASPAISLFILTLMSATVLPLLLPDLLLGGRRSGVSRYLIPCYLAIELAVAHYLATQVAQTGWRRKVGRTALVTLALAGVLSCGVSSQAEVWWIKSVDRSGSYPEIARIINRSEAPLLISDSSRAIGTLSLSHRLDDKVMLQLIPEDRTPRVPDGFSDVFVLDGSRELFRALSRRQNFNAVEVYDFSPSTFSLWRLERRSP